MKRRFRQYVAPLLFFTVLMLSLKPIPAAAATSITLNGVGSGRTFDGVGGLSGGGGASPLLYFYPAQQQAEILDYLFKPNYGASLQILKVEIGGDVNSTQGAEPSHERTSTDRNYRRGYEWWLMQQAKLRNPNIKLYGLIWGLPNWVGLYSQNHINYIIDWVKGAQSTYGLHIDYVGGANENGSWSNNFFVNLKAALQNNGLTTQVIGADLDWEPIVTNMGTDPALKNAVDIIGVHYPCGWGYQGSPGIDCSSPAAAQNLGKPLWASENGTGHADSNAGALARSINRDYIEGKMTASINWTLIDSWYINQQYAGDGLMIANEPWSGRYYVAKSIWASAHTTQFAQPGWQFIDSASGPLGGNKANGTYITLKSTNNSDYSVIIETTTASASQTANFSVTGGLSAGQVHVWATNMNSADPNAWFIHQTDITPIDGAYSVTLQPGYVYSLTTTTGQSKGATTSPAYNTLPLPYSDNFESYTIGAMPNIPKYFTSIQGAFEVENCANGRTGKCLRQEIAAQPYDFQSTIGGSDPSVEVGDPHWINYRVSTDAMLEQAGSVTLVARLNAGASNPTQGLPSGYWLQVNTSGNWSMFRRDSNTNQFLLAAGSVPFPVGSWHNLALSVNGSTIQALYDNIVIATTNDTTFATGNVGLVVSKWQNAQFDNFNVQSGISSNASSFDDLDTTMSYWGGGWIHGSCDSDLCYLFSHTWNNTTNDYMTFPFTGRQIKLYGLTDSYMGDGAVSIDGGTETNVGFYAAHRAGQTLVWISPALNSGVHTLKIRVTGTHPSSSSGNTIVLDRVDVLSVPGSGVDAGTYDDQDYTAFNYMGSAWQHDGSGCVPNCYSGTNSWDNITNDSATVTFSGTQINLYGVKDPGHGIGAVSIDGGGEANVDFYAATRAGNQLLWSSPILTNGTHTFKLRVTGNKNASSSNTWITPDRVDVIGGSNATPTFVPPTSTPAGGISSTAWYNVINQNSNKCVDAAGFGTADGTKVVQWGCGTGMNQQWQFQPTQSGYYKVIPRYSNTLVWDVTGGPGATGDGALMELWTFGGGTNQQWQAVALGGGYYKFVAQHSGKCLEVPAWSTADNTQLTQYTCNGGANQSFRLVQQP